MSHGEDAAGIGRANHRPGEGLPEREPVERSGRAPRTDEHALRGAEEQLEDFIDNAPIGAHRIGPDGTILWANRAELQLLGYAREEYVGRPIAEFHTDRAVLDDILARLHRNEALHDHPARLRAKDGSVKHVLISSNACFRDGELLHARCFTRDVTDRRQADDTLRLREQLQQVVTDALPVLVAFVDAQRRYRFVTAAYERWFGHTKHEILGKHLAEVLGPQAYETIRGHVDRALAGETVRYGAEVPYRVGGARYIEATYIPQLADDGAVSGFVALVADVSERKQLERLNAAAAARAEQLYRFAHVVVTADCVEQVFEAALAAIEGALGTTRAAILLFDDNDVMRFRAFRRLSDEYRRAVEGHSPWPRDATAPAPVLVPDVANDTAMSSYHALLRNEEIGALAFIPLMTRGRLLGKFMVYYGEPHPFTAHEIELAGAIANLLASATARFSAVAKLEETIRHNELFAGVLAHDLRNPLGAIMTAAQLVLMRQEGEGDRSAKPLGRILTSGQRMTRMIDQLLDFTRARAGGGIEISPRETNLAELCAQAVGEIELVYPEWKIQCDVSGDQNGSWDPDRLLQIISNLVANAGQHGLPESGIRIELDGRDADCVAFRIHNAGAIPAALLPALFDPFRNTRHRRDQSRGVGLGLFIVREIVRAHGGTVDVASRDSGGTTFTIRLPREAGKPI